MEHKICWFCNDYIKNKNQSRYSSEFNKHVHVECLCGAVEEMPYHEDAVVMWKTFGMVLPNEVTTPVEFVNYINDISKNNNNKIKGVV